MNIPAGKLFQQLVLNDDGTPINFKRLLELSRSPQVATVTPLALSLQCPVSERSEASGGLDLAKYLDELVRDLRDLSVMQVLVASLIPTVTCR